MARLIDAELLRETLYRQCDTFKARKDWAAYSAISNVIIMLDNTPTIDATPVRHGRWKEFAGWPDNQGAVYCMWQCNECNEILCGTTGAYCPNCGAKMDGGENDD